MLGLYTDETRHIPQGAQMSSEQERIFLSRHNYIPKDEERAEEAGAQINAFCSVWEALGGPSEELQGVIDIQNPGSNGDIRKLAVAVAMTITNNALSHHQETPYGLLKDMALDKVDAWSAIRAAAIQSLCMQSDLGSESDTKNVAHRDPDMHGEHTGDDGKFFWHPETELREAFIVFAAGLAVVVCAEGFEWQGIDYSRVFLSDEDMRSLAEFAYTEPA